MPNKDASALLCPECRGAIDRERLACTSCGWRGELLDGVPVLLSAADRADPTFASYLQNYDRIAQDDLGQPILDLKYVNHQANNLLYFVDHPQGRRILDLGCGRGVLARRLIERGATLVTGVDLSIAYLSKLAGSDGIEPVCANAENLPFNEEFDIAVSTDVMEHVLNVGSFLVSLNRVLRPAGHAYIRVPYDENLLNYSPALGCKYRFVHLRSFNRKLLAGMLSAAGFRAESFRFDGFVPGIHRDFWKAAPIKLVHRFEDFLLRLTKDRSSITTWPPALASLWWKPLEVVVKAKKTHRIIPNKTYGYELAKI